jgi:hypothetical protein
MAAYSHGAYQSHYRRPSVATEEKFVVFYDISPSQDKYVPYCNEIVFRNKADLHEKKLYCFSGSGTMSHVDVREFTRVVKEGGQKAVRSEWGDGSTNFNQVVREMRNEKLTKAIIITDNRAPISTTNREWLERTFTKKKKENVLVIVNTTHVSGSGKSLDPQRGFLPYATHLVDLDAD